MIAPKPFPIRIDRANTWPRPRPKKVFRPRRKPVTIAIGFAYDGGMLLCADTGVTGAAKLYQSKIERRVSDDGNCSMIFASSAVDLNFPLSAISKCWEAVRGMDFKARSLEQVHHAAEFSLAEFYSTHIYPHPDRSPDAPYLQLLVGIWVRGEHCLYLSNETVLNPVAQYECIGAGAYLANYIVGQYFKANRGSNSLADAALISRHAVQSAIDYDHNCGGSPEMLIVRSDGTVATGCMEIGYPDEKFIAGFGDLGWKMIHDLANLPPNEHLGKPAEERIEKLSKDVLYLDLDKWNF